MYATHIKFWLKKKYIKNVPSSDAYYYLVSLHQILEFSNAYFSVSNYNFKFVYSLICL